MVSTTVYTVYIYDVNIGKMSLMSILIDYINSLETLFLFLWFQCLKMRTTLM